MDISKLVQDISKMIEQDKQAVIIRAEGMLAGVALLAQAIEQEQARLNTDIETTDEG